MTVYSTLDKLDDMKMTAMCDVYRFQLEDSTVHSLSLDERFVMLVDDQFISRQKYRGLVHNAESDQPQASITGIKYIYGRKLDPGLIHTFFSYAFIQDNPDVVITGTGRGKNTPA